MAGPPKNNILVPEDNSIVARKLAVDAVITDKIKDRNVTNEKLADGAVTTEKLADGAIPVVVIPYRMPMEEIPDDIVEEPASAGTDSTVVGIHVFAASPPTVGPYTLDVINLPTGNSMLASPPSDLMTLTGPYEVTILALTTVEGDLVLPEGELFNVVVDATGNPDLDVDGLVAQANLKAG